MATDTLEIFGTEYTGVAGIKATDDNSNTKTYIRPQGTLPITSNGTGIDVTEYASVDVAVPSPSSATYTLGLDERTATVGSDTYWRVKPKINVTTAGTVAVGEVIDSGGSAYPTLSATTITPTTSQQTVGANGTYMLGAVTVNAMPSGTEGTPTATKSAVSNHSVTVTPSVTNSAGYISGGTHTGTAVTVSASELVSGSETKTANGTYDVTNLAELVVNVSGGGGTLTVKTATITKTSTGQTLSFTSLSGHPKYWFLRATTNVSSSGSTTYYYVTDLFYDGTNIKGNTFRIGSTRRVQNITSGITQSYSSGTLTITAGSSSGATPGQFYGASSFGYELVYIY